MKLIFLLFIGIGLIGCSGTSTDAGSSDPAYSELTCPECGHLQYEKMPTESCQIMYTCEKCGESFHPKEGDCCVYCSYGTHKCPSMQ